MDDLALQLERLNEIGAALSAERDREHLLERIIEAAKTLTHADGGTLYRMRDDGRALTFAIVRNDSLGIALGGPSGVNPITFPDLPLVTAEGAPNNTMVAAWAAIHGKTVNIADAYREAGFDFSGTRRFDAGNGYRSQSFLTVPMKNHEQELIGVLQLINAQDATGTVVPFSAAQQQVAESLASQAAVALTNQQLIAQLETLFESLINLINVAIDDKSPYTGGHCVRVPKLTTLIAQAVNATHEGPLAEVQLSDADLYELSIAAQLHDCGKVVTPVHVVDKATKLETLFDRIHLLDTRFEVLRRDARIRMLEACLANPQAAESLREAAAEEDAAIEADRAFLRRVNMGTEFMQPEDVQRVRDISTSRAWTNPAGETVPFLSDDEIENLTIRAGTLTGAEREIINHHIVATIAMLESLPWPKHLARVPEYAGGHHERMDGKGYPRGLTREQMSWQARMVGLADIFEALTAKDRPYRVHKTVSQALGIMKKMSAEGHIDPDLFEVFLQQEIPLRYAQAFLDPAQIDI